VCGGESVVSEAPLCGNENQLVLLYIAITLGECAWLLLRNWSHVRDILSLGALLRAAFLNLTL